MKRFVRAGSPEILKIAGDSSPETSFRELDDVFWQSQTRIWLGEVLHIRFDEETSISDLLADGELLFQVSKVVWKMLLKKNGELKHSKVYIYERTSFGKSDGRYMPYPKVDSFLKICQILGLTGVDLFSPSDVVEKRDVRRVCMCIRSLSKKARSKNLNVPDFDIVTYTIVMPTNLVGGIRRNLELSQYSSSSSNGCSSPSMDLREIYRQKSPSGQYTLHYDSYSDSDESAFPEFEFQSPLSNASYEATNFSNIIGQISPEVNSIVDGDLSELQAQFSLDTQEQFVHERSIQNGSQECRVTLHSKSSSNHTECQIDQGAGARFPNTREVMWHKNIIEINNVETGSYQNFASTYVHSPQHLDEPHAVDAEETFKPFGLTLWSNGLKNSLPKCSSSVCDINPDHPKEEFVKVFEGPSAQAQTGCCRLEDDSVRSEYMGSSNKDTISEFQDMVVLPWINKVHAEGKKENSGISTFKMDPSNYVDEVSLPGNCIKCQSNTSDLIHQGIDEGNDQALLANSSSRSMGAVDIDQKDIKNGLKRKAVDEAEAAQVYSVSSSISSEDKYANNGCTANNFIPQINGPREIALCDPIIDTSADEHASALDEEAMESNEYSDLVTCESVEIDDTARDPSALVDSFSCDNEDMDSCRTFSSNIGMELISLGIPNDPPLDTDCHTVSCSDTDFVKNGQASPSQLDSDCDPLNMQCGNDSFTSSQISDSCYVNDSKYTISPNGCCSEDSVILEECDNIYASTCDIVMDAGEQLNNPIMSNIYASTCDIEMDAGEQLNNPIMSILNEDMTANDLSIGESKIHKRTNSNGSENQIKILPCNSQAEVEMKVGIVQDQETSKHPCEIYQDPPLEVEIEVKHNYTEELGKENSFPVKNTSLPQIKILHVGCQESGEQVPLPTTNRTLDKEVLSGEQMLLPMGNGTLDEVVSSLEHCLIERIEIHGLETGEMNSSDESTDIHNVKHEIPSKAGASEAICTHVPAHGKCMACTTRSTCVQDSIKSHEILPCSTSWTTEREFCVVEGINVNDQGVSPLIDDVCTSKEPEEADGNGQGKKDREESEDLLPKLDSSGKGRARGNKVLKSVAGVMTLLGALFLFHHISRQKREKEKITEPIVPQQTHKPTQEVSRQKRKEIVKPGVLYPGERLKF